MSRFNKKDIYGSIINFIICCFGFAIILLALMYSRQAANNIYVEDITEQWKNYYGKEIDLSKICEQTKVKGNNKFYASYNLERKVNRNYTLVFRANSCFVNVDGKLALADVDEQNAIFGKSPGNRWHMVSVNSDKKNCKISIEVKPVYKNGTGSINNVYVGSPLGVVKQVLWDRIVGFLISVVLVLLGIILCAIYAFAYKKQRNLDEGIVVNKIIPKLGCLTIIFLAVFYREVTFLSINVSYISICNCINNRSYCKRFDT